MGVSCAFALLANWESHFGVQMEFCGKQWTKLWVIVHIWTVVRISQTSWHLTAVYDNISSTVQRYGGTRSLATSLKVKLQTLNWCDDLVIILIGTCAALKRAPSFDEPNYVGVTDEIMQYDVSTLSYIL